MLKVGLLQASFEKVKPYADAFVDAFYSNLFIMYPSSQALFEKTNMATQKKMLLNSLVLTVENLNNPDILTEKLQGLGAQHVKYGALPEHYPLVGNALLATFEQFLGNDWTEETKKAWGEAYGSIAELMLSGADYSLEEISLDSVPPVEENISEEKSLESAPPLEEDIIEEKSLDSTPPTTIEPVVVSGEINWEIFGGLFAVGGIGTVLLLFLL